MNTNRIRSKWAAVGAAIAVSLGAGGIGITHATTSTGEKPIYLPIEPCRLADTRPAFQVGPRPAPLGPNETYDLSGWGAVGDCTLPANTAGLALNVTAVDPTAATFLTLFPAGVPLPLASNLNPTPGEPPTPNAVNVDLNAAGDFSIYNLAGNVHIIVDVVGIYDDHNHDDIYYQKSEVDTAISEFQPPNPFALNGSTASSTTTGQAFQTVLATSITVPDGYTAVLKADFTAESSCNGGGYSAIMMFADGTEMQPAVGTGFTFDTDDGGSWEGNAVTRTLTVGPGSYNIRVRAGGTVAGTSFRVDDTSLFVEAFLQRA